MLNTPTDLTYTGRFLYLWRKFIDMSKRIPFIYLVKLVRDMLTLLTDARMTRDKSERDKMVKKLNKLSRTLTEKTDDNR